MTFRIGQKIIFVGGDTHPLESKDRFEDLEINSIYTIRDIDPIYIRHYGYVGIRTFEVVAPSVHYNGELFEPAILSYKFRPIIERKTSIEIFTAMLTPATAGADA